MARSDGTGVYGTLAHFISTNMLPMLRMDKTGCHMMRHGMSDEEGIS